VEVGSGLKRRGRAKGRADGTIGFAQHSNAATEIDTTLTDEANAL